MTILDAIILGLVEGITEYLPVSSTGHLIITSSLLGLDRDEQVKSAVDAFNIVIQGGAILAVLGLYRVRVLSMIRGLLGKDAGGRRLFLNLVIAFLPAAVLGVLLDDLIEAALFRPWPVIGALAVGGLLLLGMKRWQDRVFASAEGDGAEDRFTDIEHLTWKQALIVGFLQCVAMWPGTSRSMMTIVGGMLVGLRPKQAAEFSFLLGLPTLGGACVYKALKSGDEIAALGAAPIVVGIAVATISAAFAVKWLVGYLAKHGLAAFGWYRIALAIVLAALWFGGVVSFGPDQPAGEASPVASASSAAG
ncbi:MAG: undecaprenyl-diphosphate phosphatase [Planctomycetota bacterium]|nr:undecaprenyl-diphosphate phosphatase [Planctomycetota bacterium]